MARPKHASRQTALLLQHLLTHRAWLHGYALIEATGVKSGTVYPMLMRLEDDGFLETRWQEAPRSGSSQGRPPRHLYRLTQSGVKLAEQRIAAQQAKNAKSRRAGPATA